MERMGNVLAHLLGREVDMKKQTRISSPVQLVRRVFSRILFFVCIERLIGTKSLEG
jgi:hypothetical protein